MAIVMTLNRDNHILFLAEILRIFQDKEFNVLVQTKKIGDETIKELKFCSRKIGLQRVVGTNQVSIKLEPGYCIAWDLKTESVLASVEEDKVIITRFWNNRQYRKVVILTTNPI